MKWLAVVVVAFVLVACESADAAPVQCRAYGAQIWVGGSIQGDDGRYYWCWPDGSLRLTVPVSVYERKPVDAGGGDYCWSDGIDWTNGTYYGHPGAYGAGMQRDYAPAWCWRGGRWHDKPER